MQIINEMANFNNFFLLFLVILNNLNILNLFLGFLQWIFSSSPMISLDYAKTTLFFFYWYTLVFLLNKIVVFIMYIYKAVFPAAFTEAKRQ